MRHQYIRFFISSTFHDMEMERNWLQKVFDRLIPEYKQKGWQIETVDLRWGISEEASLNNKTMQICMQELCRSQKMSPKPNFIVLLGNRYGWIPIPEVVSRVNQQSLVLTKEERTLFHQWYRLDENALPEGDYILQGRRDRFCDSKIWKNDVETPLRIMFQRNAERLQDAQIFGRSATEQEIWQGALNVKDAAEHVMAYLRNLNDVPTEKKVVYYEDEVACQHRIEELKAELRKHLSDSNIIEKTIDYESFCSPNYASAFMEEVEQHLRAIINHTIQNDQQGTMPENEKHIAYAKDQAAHFIGREHELDFINQYLQSDDPRPLWIKASSGMGKSALLAKVVDLYKERYDIICRFCGTTEQSSEAMSLVKSLFNDLDKRDTRDRKRVLPVTISWGKGLYAQTPNEALSSKCKAMTMDRPILIVVDAIDQVNDAGYQSFKYLSWLSSGKNPNIRIICSSIEEGFPDQNNKWVYHLSGLGTDAVTMLHHRLRSAQRRLSESQWTAIGQIIKASDKSPLYVQVLSQYLQKVPSWEDVEGLPSALSELINKILNDLSQNQEHGEAIVRMALSLMATDRVGLSDEEIMEILASDDNFYSYIQKKSFHDLPTDSHHRLPVILWIRLCNDLQTILRKQISDVGQINIFFHKGIRRIVSERYMTNDKSSFHFWLLLTKLYIRTYQNGDKHALMELAYAYYMLACYFSKENDFGSFRIFRDELTSLLTRDWNLIGWKKQYFPVSLTEDYDRTQRLYFSTPNPLLNLFRNQLNRLEDPVNQEQVRLYFKNLPSNSLLRQSLEQSPFTENMMNNLLADFSNREGTLYMTKEVGEAPCLSEDGTVVASLFEARQQVRIDNLLDAKLSRNYKWPAAIREMQCDKTLRYCALRSDSWCLVHDVKDNKIMLQQSLGADGWMSLSADGQTFVCGDKKGTYLYQSHQHTLTIGDVTYAKLSDSGVFLWLLTGQGKLERYNMQENSGCGFPVRIQNIDGNFYCPWEDPTAVITACSEERCCCKTSAQTIEIHHYLDSQGRDQFKISYGNQFPKTAYSPDGVCNIDETGHCWKLDDNGEEQLIGHFYMGEHLDCINRSFTKALSVKEQRVFDLTTEMGNYLISEVYQNGYINHCSCSSDGEEICVSVGVLYEGDFSKGNKAELLRFSHQRMHSWIAEEGNCRNGIYSAAIAPDGTWLAISPSLTPPSLWLCETQNNQLIAKIPLPQRQSGCTDIIFSPDSEYVLGLTGDYVADPETIFLLISNRRGESVITKEWSRDYGKSLLWLSPDNRYIILENHSGYCVYDLINDEFVVDYEHCISFSSYVYYQERCFLTLRKNFVVYCPSLPFIFSSGKEELLQFNLQTGLCQKTPCDKTIIACSATGRNQFFLDDEHRLYSRDWLVSSHFTYLMDDVLWVVPALDDDHIFITQTNYTILLFNTLTHEVEQMAYRGITTHQRICAQGLLTVNTSCEVSLYQASEKWCVNTPAVTTFVRKWDLHSRQQDESPSAICPACGKKLKVPSSIENLLMSVPSHPQVKHWDNPQLKGHRCPYCSKELLFNPYII